MATDRRAQRRAATCDEILAAAWDLARENGLAGIGLRELGARVGMRAQSLYTYYPSKNAIYDAMFEQGYRDFLDWMSAGGDPETGGALDVLRRDAHRFFDFCVADPVRYQLLFLRTIPGFEPSPASYAVAIAALELQQRRFAAAGITDPAAADLATAVLTGLTSQQIANDPGGDRWERLVDRAVRMLVAETAPHLLAHPHPTTRPATRPTSRKKASR